MDCAIFRYLDQNHTVDPYPWAIEEGFDAYRTIMETRGRCIGIKSDALGCVLTGDSA